MRIKKHIGPDVKMCVAVKADGYGHGSVLVSEAAVSAGADFLAVARVDEGIRLRKSGITARILLLSLCQPEDFPELFRYNITPFVFGKEHIAALAKAAEAWFGNAGGFPEKVSSIKEGGGADGFYTGTESLDAARASSETGGSISEGILPEICGFEAGKRVSSFSESFAVAGRFPVHLAVDTGMGRIGCLPQDAGEEARLIMSSKHLFLEGMGTHFAVSDSLSPDNSDYTEMQFADFCLAVENVKREGIDPGIRHAGASAVILNRADFHLDMVRPGIIAYGYYPDEITREYLSEKRIDLELKPVMQFETRVSAIRRFEKGRSVSYGRTWTASEDTDIAVLPVGYADGLLRRFSPRLKVAINGKEYPVVGRICMDQCMVDIGRDNSEVCVWDKAVIFGPIKDRDGNGEAMQDAESLARLGNTISYEVLTSIGKRVERVEV